MKKNILLYFFCSLFMISLFGQNCTISTLPYTENFDSYPSATAGFIPPCWHFIHSTPNDSQMPYVMNNFSYSSPNSLLVYASLGNNSYGLMPPIDSSLTMQTLKIDFELRTYFRACSLAVGIMSDTADITTFVPIESMPVQTTWQHVTVYFNTYQGAGRYIVFKALPGAFFAQVFVDNIEITTTSTCQTPTDLEISNITGSSAYVSWTPQGTPDYYQVNLTDRDGNLIHSANIVNDDYCIFTGLNEQTHYSVDLFASCSGTSSDTVTQSFGTNCANNQELIVGTSTTLEDGNLLPYATYNRYSFTEQIFTADELSNEAMTIKAISFQYGFASSVLADMKIYLGHTNQTQFLASNQWVPLDSLTQVFEGEMLFHNGNLNNWCTILLDTDFVYNGVDNLVLAIDDNKGSTSVNSDKFFTHSLIGFPTIYAVSDNDINPSLLGSIQGTMISNRANVKFSKPCGDIICIAPGLTVSYLSSDSLAFVITPGASESQWDVEYKTENDTLWSNSIHIATTNSSINNLMPNTDYMLRIRSICSISEMSEWDTLTFRTLCSTIDSIPWMDNFDSYNISETQVPDCFTIVSNNLSSPSLSTPFYSAPYSFYLYGNSNFYSIVSLPELNPQIDITSLQLNLNAYGLNVQSFVEVGVMTDPNVDSTFVPMATVTIPVEDVWHSFEVPFDTYVGNGKFIAIRCDSRSLGITNGIYIDDVELTHLSSCRKPTSLAVNNITQNGASLSWQGVDNASYYDIAYGPHGIHPDSASMITMINDTFYLFNLEFPSNTEMEVWVRSDCGSDNSNWSNSIVFYTLCDPITQQDLPYFENFDSYQPLGRTVFPECWESNYNYYPPFVSSLEAYSGGNSLVYYNFSPSAEAFAYLPPIDVSLPLNTLQVSFFLFNEDTLSPLVFGILNSLDEFIVIDTLIPTSLEQWQYFEVPLVNTTLAEGLLTFKFSGVNPIYIDDVMISIYNPCLTPTTLAATDVSNTSALLNWVERGEATSWIIEYGPSGFQHGDGTILTVTQNPFSLQGLTPSTNYDFYVRSICNASSESEWSFSHSFRTGQCPIELTCPYSFFLIDSYGDGWNDATMSVFADSLEEAVLTLPSGLAFLQIDLNICHQSNVTLQWTEGNFDGEVSFFILNNQNDTICSVDDVTTFDFSLFNFVANCETDTIIPVIDTCFTPDNLQASNVSYNSATISWIPGDDEENWNLEYRPINEDLFSSLNTSSNTITLSDLISDTLYEVRVQAICSDTSFSSYSPISTFTTLPNSIQSFSEGKDYSIYPNPVDNQLTIMFSNLSMNPSQILVIDQLGRLLNVYDVVNDIVELDFAFYSSGIYFVQIKCADNVITKKVIKF